MSFEDDYKHLKISLKDVESATNDFGDKPIGTGGFGKVYKGELYLLDGQRLVAFKRLDRKCGQGDVEFWKEIVMLSKLRHENLVSLLHFCNEGEERILVYEFVSRGSLDSHLGDPNLSWIQRILICIGAARGLKYLHDPTKTHDRVLHRDIKSSNILIDEEGNAKLSDFGLSKIGPANQSCTYLISNVVGTYGYCDPLYFQTGQLSKESDGYSFGVVLFEVMCGRICHEYHNGKLVGILVNAWKNCYDEDRLGDIIHPDLKEQIDEESLKTFSAIANRCLSLKRQERPTMDEIITELEVSLQQQISHQDKPKVVKSLTSYKSKEEFHNLKIHLEDITSATNNFNHDSLIGRGGFGSIYKGVLSLRKGLTTVAVKRLDRSLGQGDTEFWNEITMLSSYKQENLISLLGFCDESDERIIVYEYAPRGSLDCHLSDTSLSWAKRLKICIGAAQGLQYLHDQTGTRQVVLHRDIKSSSILLDENWKAKVSDLGLSKIILANHSNTYLISNVVGTPGYCDPLYMAYGVLRKESDVYAFGVVLLEVLCGSSCFEYGGGNFVNLRWEKYYEKRVDDIVFPVLWQQMEPSSLNTFSTVAFRCLKKSREERPSMAEIVKELEKALKQQESSENLIDHVVPL